MARANVNGVELSYEALGTGVPLLFIHGGYGGPATTLVPQRQVVAEILPRDRVRTIIYDRRNAGQSQYTLSEYTLADLAGDAAALLDELGEPRAIIMGSSAGGPIALQFALSWPERVIGLCLPNTGANLLSEERPVGRERKMLVARARAEGDRAVFESRKERLRKPPEVAPTGPGAVLAAQRNETVRKALAAVTDEDLFLYSTGEIRNFGAYEGFDFTPRLAELKMPVCIIHGRSDRTVPFAWGEALHDGMPGSELHPIEGADHGILAYSEAAVALRMWVDAQIA